MPSHMHKTSGQSILYKTPYMFCPEVDRNFSRTVTHPMLNGEEGPFQNNPPQCQPPLIP